MKTTQKIIAHMGFQKTGTSSLQSYLREYRDPLKPYCDIYLGEQLGALYGAGREYGHWPSLRQKLAFRMALRDFLNKIEDAKTIIITRESFVGIMPGFRRFGFIMAKSPEHTAKTLANEMVRGLQKRFGKDVEIVLLYTTREKQAWLKSVWGHVTRSIEQKKTRDEFVNDFKNIPSLDDMVANIALSLPQIKVIAAPLEKYSKNPALALLELLDLPENFVRNHPPMGVKNMGESYELICQFVQMNRSVKDKSRLKLEKAKLADLERMANGLKPIYENRLGN